MAAVNCVTLPMLVLIAALCVAILVFPTSANDASASPDAVYVLCQTIKRYYELTDYRVGLKISGGVRAAEEAVAFYTIVKEVLGERWLDKTHLRFGASRLNEDLLRKLE